MQARKRRSLIIGGTALGAAAGSTFVAIPAAHAEAKTYTVTNLADTNVIDDGSLRDALNKANANPGTDTIQFQTGLTGTLTLLHGQLTISDSVNIVGLGPITTTVSGGNDSRVFYIYSDGGLLDVSISGLTITKGASSFGAGIADVDENLTLDNVLLTENFATGDGGGLWIGGGDDFTLAVTRSAISGNGVGDRGGGVFVDQQPQTPVPFNPARETNETAVPLGPNDVSFVNSIISANAANEGGGAYVTPMATGQFVVDHSAVARNAAADSGGGLFFESFDDKVEISESTISGNDARSSTGLGGGIYGIGSSASGGIIDHTTIAGNDAGGVGGGISLDDGSMILSNVLLADNTADDAADISAPSSNVNINYSLVETQAGFTPTGGVGLLFGVDPMLGALAANGGPTPTQTPALNSPVVDAGDPASVDPGDGDQRHATRVVGARIDIGAVEVVPPPANDHYSTNEDVPLSVPVTGVLANDPDAAHSTVAPGSQAPVHGDVTLNANGSFTYTPDADFNGTDSFTYTQTGSLGQNTGTATVTIDVAPVNDRPDAVDDIVQTPLNTPIVILALSNDTDPDGDALTIRDAKQGVKGAVVYTPNQITYTPNPGATGTDTFTYSITDGSLGDDATITVGIGGVPVVTTTTPPNVLPASGKDSVPTTAVALGLLGAGGLLTGISRRRRRGVNP